MESSVRYYAIVPAAGVGSRMQSSIPKQYLNLCDKPLIHHTLTTLLEYPKIVSVVLVLNSQDSFWSSHELKHSKLIQTVGGKERYDSVLNGLQALKSKAMAQDWVLVHDAVRPCLEPSDIDNLISKLNSHPVGGLLGAVARDTIKRANGNQEVTETLERSQIWQAFTPQMFRFEVLKEALELAIQQQEKPTDEASAIESIGLKPMLVQGKRSNIKITNQEDLALAEFYINSRYRNKK